MVWLPKEMGSKVTDAKVTIIMFVRIQIRVGKIKL